MATYDELHAQSVTSGGAKPDVCAVLTSHLFQAYSWYLQDLSDAIIGELTVRMTAALEKTSANYKVQAEEQAVKLFLDEASA